jgi:hypothetical protein
MEAVGEGEDYDEEISPDKEDLDHDLNEEEADAKLKTV